MPAFNFNLRGLSSEVMFLLKKKAKKLDTSVNSLILRIVEQGLGLTSKKVSYHDLDPLAGTWSAAEEEEFVKNTDFFEQIDKELWK